MKNDLKKYPLPEQLIIKPLSWQYLLRSILREKNTLLIGPTGCGKTFAAEQAVLALGGRTFAKINLGSTQDPRAVLIGNTHLDKERGTFFSQSYFVQMIQVPNAVILLDELSRANPEAWNILMTVLDVNQRYLRLDESPDSPLIKVAPGVCFIATANIGAEYTAVRVLDRALFDRFAAVIELAPLSAEDEYKLLKLRFPNCDSNTLKSIARIAWDTRSVMNADDRDIQTFVSTRMSLEAAHLIDDGFTLAEAAEACIYPFFSDIGDKSERMYMKQVVQKYLPITEKPVSPEGSVIKQPKAQTKPKPFTVPLNPPDVPNKTMTSFTADALRAAVDDFNKKGIDPIIIPWDNNSLVG